MNWADKTVDEAKLRTFIREHRLGSFLNSPLAGDGPGVWTAKEWRQAMYTIQHIAKEEGVLPLIHGLDSVHGANYVKNATIFPQQHGLGATFNPVYAYEMGRVTARDTMAAGVQWIYGPILDLGVNSRWFVHADSGTFKGWMNFLVLFGQFISCLFHPSWGHPQKPRSRSNSKNSSFTCTPQAAYVRNFLRGPSCSFSHGRRGH